MKVMRVVVSLITVLLGLVAVVQASDRVGIYALVERVVLEPSGDAATQIQVWGAFALAKGRGFTYEEPVRGYLYYVVPSGKEDLARKEWAYFKSVAGTRQLVAFGARYQPTGRVREADEKPASPDVYPVDFGLSKLSVESSHAPVEALLALLGARKP